jgi:hypothetical protein
LVVQKKKKLQLKLHLLLLQLKLLLLLQLLKLLLLHLLLKLLLLLLLLKLLLLLQLLLHTNYYNLAFSVLDNIKKASKEAFFISASQETTHLRRLSSFNLSHILSYAPSVSIVDPRI